MNVEEVILSIRTTATGVQQVIADLQKIQAHKDKLREELRFNVVSSGVLELKKNLDGLSDSLIRTSAASEGSSANSLASIKNIASLYNVAAGAVNLFTPVLKGLKLKPAVLALIGIAEGISLIASVTREQSNAQEELNQRIKMRQELISARVTQDNINEKIAERDEIRKIIDEYDVLLDTYDSLIRRKEELNEAGIRSRSQAEALIEIERQLNEIREEVGRKGESLSGIREDYAGLNEEIEEFNGNLRVQNNALAAQERHLQRINELNQKKDTHIAQVNQLSRAYEKLSQGQALSLNEMLDLIRAYPKIAAYIAETNDLTLKRGDLLQYIAGESERMTLAELERERVSVESAIRAAEQRVEVAEWEFRTKAKFSMAEAEIAQNAFNDAKQNLESYRQRLNEIAASIAAITSIQFSGGGSRFSGGGGIISSRVEELERERQILDDWFSKEMQAIQELDRGRADNTDFQGIINRLKELREQVVKVYADFPERLQAWRLKLPQAALLA